MDLKNGIVVLGGVNWHWMFESIVFSLGGVQRRLGLLCEESTSVVALFHYNDGDPPTSLASNVVTVLSCVPIHFTSGVTYGFPDPCSVTSCLADIHE